jgi:hypothetical protein
MKRFQLGASVKVTEHLDGIYVTELNCQDNW